MISINFDFKHFREESDLQQLNALLSTMPLQDLHLEDEEGYLCTTKDGAEQVLGRRYGLDSGTLHCKIARWSPGYHYQIDTFTENPGEDHKERIRKWMKKHPDRDVCFSIVKGFETCDCYIIVHRGIPKNSEF